MALIISELLISIVCFLGLFVGLFIGYKTKEELKSGKKYFSALQKTIFILIVFFIFYEVGLWLIGLLFVVFFSVVLFQLRKDFHRIMYFITAAFLYMSFSKGVLVIPALVFFYGFPLGTLFLFESKKKKFFDLVIELFLRYYIFLIVIIVLMLIK